MTHVASTLILTNHDSMMIDDDSAMLEDTRSIIGARPETATSSYRNEPLT